MPLFILKNYIQNNDDKFQINVWQRVGIKEFLIKIVLFCQRQS